MKKLFVLAMVATALTIFNGCQKEELGVSQLADEMQPQNVVRADMYVEGDYLVFKDFEALDSLKKDLNKMTDEEIQRFEKELGFKSARADFDILFNEYETLQTYEEFLAFKEQYKDNLIFNNLDVEDCSIDYPYTTRYFLPVLNNEGVYKVGKSIIKYTKVDQFVIADGDADKLKNINSHRDNENVIVFPKLKAFSNSFTRIDFFEDNDPKTGDNKWHMKSDISNRRINNKLYVEQYLYNWFDYNTNTEVWTNGIRVMLNQRGQKNTILGWKDYYTTYGIKNIKCKVANLPTYEDIRIHTSAEVKPSIDFHLAHYWQNTPYVPSSYMPVPTVSFAAEVTFRGFGFISSSYYPIDSPDGYGLGGVNDYPSTDWGW